MNINELKTIEKFGYNIIDLKPSSNKLVIWFCSNCLKEKDKQFKYAKKINLCLICSNIKNANTSLDKRSNKLKEYFKNNDHPLKNTKRPKHVIDAMINGSKNHIRSELERSAISKRMKGKNNPFYGKKHSDELMAKIVSKRKVRKGKDSNLYGKIFHPKKKNNPYKDIKERSFLFRSSWELKVAKYLDENKIDWNYELNTFPLIINKKDCTYTPDFYIIKENKYLEVKGYWRGDSLIKFNEFKKQYLNINIEVWDKIKLKELNIL